MNPSSTNAPTKHSFAMNPSSTNVPHSSSFPDWQTLFNWQRMQHEVDVNTTTQAIGHAQDSATDNMREIADTVSESDVASSADVTADMAALWSRLEVLEKNVVECREQLDTCITIIRKVTSFWDETIKGISPWTKSINKIIGNLVEQKVISIDPEDEEVRDRWEGVLQRVE